MHRLEQLIQSRLADCRQQIELLRTQLERATLTADILESLLLEKEELPLTGEQKPEVHHRVDPLLSENSPSSRELPLYDYLLSVDLPALRESIDKKCTRITFLSASRGPVCTLSLSNVVLYLLWAQREHDRANGRQVGIQSIADITELLKLRLGTKVLELLSAKAIKDSVSYLERSRHTFTDNYGKILTPPGLKKARGIFAMLSQR